VAARLGDGENVQARILVVDDEAPVRRLLARLLEQNGYSCGTAGDARQATVALEAEPFDLLLTDMNMPGESGLDLIRAASEKYPGLATVMVTGLDDRALANAALELGAYGYIIKPFESNEILISVTNALRRRALEIENRGTRRVLNNRSESGRPSSGTPSDTSRRARRTYAGRARRRSSASPSRPSSATTKRAATFNG